MSERNRDIIAAGLRLLIDLTEATTELNGTPVFADVFIAGGAARDSYLGTDIRDLDIIIQRVDGVTDEDVKTALEAAMFTRGSIVIADATYGDDQEQHYAQGTLVDAGVIVDFIEEDRFKSRSDILRSFPDDLSRIIVPASGVPEFGLDFIDAAGTQTITIRPGYDDRYLKLTRKFPDFKVKVEGDHPSAASSLATE